VSDELAQLNAEERIGVGSSPIFEVEMTDSGVDVRVNMTVFSVVARRWMLPALASNCDVRVSVLLDFVYSEGLCDWASLPGACRTTPSTNVSSFVMTKSVSSDSAFLLSWMRQRALEPAQTRSTVLAWNGAALGLFFVAAVAFAVLVMKSDEDDLASATDPSKVYYMHTVDESKKTDAIVPDSTSVTPSRDSVFSFPAQRALPVAFSTPRLNPRATPRAESELFEQTMSSVRNRRGQTTRLVTGSFNNS